MWLTHKISHTFDSQFWHYYDGFDCLFYHNFIVAFYCLDHEFTVLIIILLELHLTFEDFKWLQEIADVWVGKTH